MMSVAAPKRGTEPEPCRVAGAIDLNEIGSPPHPPPPYQNQQARQPTTDAASVSCCGCVNIRTGVFIIIFVLLLMSIVGAARSISAGVSLFGSVPEIISFLLSRASDAVLLVMLYAASNRKAPLYRRAAKVNVLAFVVSIGFGLVALAIGAGERLGPSVDLGVLALVLILVLAWFAYWAWVLYKYADVLEQEMIAKQQRSRVSV